ncbi:hypothetical protein KSP40_PGU013329 [Platanthera guangdongensis]|uniref:Uncharacterized protein n=1 Tax=Platanthera guangdongensis TaxID=2320717 RepID=A0ABR2LR65_9ASPA
MRGSTQPMPVVDDLAKRRGKDGEPLRSEKKRSREDEFHGDLHLSSDIKGIMSALQQIRDKAQKDGQNISIFSFKSCYIWKTSLYKLSLFEYWDGSWILY